MVNLFRKPDLPVSTKRMKLISTIFVCCFLAVVSAKNLPTEEFGFISGRVVGGQDAVPHSAPWIVSLHLRNTHQCGGSILNANWVLTAAHCFIGQMEVVAGRHNLRVNEAATEQRRMSDRQIAHRDYAGGVGPFDIGLIHVAVPFALTHSVHPIALPPNGLISSGTVRLNGWGSTSSGWFPSFPAILQTVNKPIVDWDTCRSVLGNSPLHPTNLCTGPLDGGISACSGDSGGPLDQNGVVVGIVSWGRIPCGQRNAPSVYVRVSAFIDWINENMV